MSGETQFDEILSTWMSYNPESCFQLTADVKLDFWLANNLPEVKDFFLLYFSDIYRQKCKKIYPRATIISIKKIKWWYISIYQKSSACASLHLFLQYLWDKCSEHLTRMFFDLTSISVCSSPQKAQLSLVGCRATFLGGFDANLCCRKWATGELSTSVDCKVELACGTGEGDRDGERILFCILFLAIRRTMGLLEGSAADSSTPFRVPTLFWKFKSRAFPGEIQVKILSFQE